MNMNKFTKANSKRLRVFVDLMWTGERTLLLGSPKQLLGGLNDMKANAFPSAGWCLDGDEFEAWTDRLGMYPLYYHTAGARLLVAPLIATLIKRGASSTPSSTGMSLLLRQGYMVGEYTPFEGIYRLRPDSLLKWCKGSLQVQARPSRPKRSLGMGRRAAEKAYGEMFQEVVDKSLDANEARVIVPLSGGRDSRHVLLALRRAKISQIDCITLRHRAPKCNEDARIAAMLAQRLSLPHTVLDQPAVTLEADLEKNVLVDFSTREGGWLMPLRRHMRSLPPGVLADGIGGDVLSNGLYCNEMTHRLMCQREWTERWLEDECYIGTLLSRAGRTAWPRDLAQNVVCEERFRYSTQNNPNAEYLLATRTRQVALSSLLMGADMHTWFAPFLADEVYDFLSMCPVEWFVTPGFHDNAVALQYPEVRDIPYASERQPSSMDTFALEQRLREMSRFFRKKKRDMWALNTHRIRAWVVMALLFHRDIHDAFQRTDLPLLIAEICAAAECCQLFASNSDNMICEHDRV